MKNDCIQNIIVVGGGRLGYSLTKALLSEGHEVLVIDQKNWKEAGRVAVAGQPVFVIARPDGRQLWVNFAPPDNDTVQVIDTLSLKIIRTLKPGKAASKALRAVGHDVRGCLGEKDP